MKVHPLAAMLPMMPDEELEDLAADIKVNGLIHPLVVDEDGQLLDGRNRNQACQIAGVEPRTITYTGGDVAAFVVGVNIFRRHLAPGQRAMFATIVARSQPGLRPKNGDLKRAAQSADVSANAIARAGVVLDWASELKEQVLAGGSLKDAYELAFARKTKAEQQKKLLAKARREYPDLVAKVDSGTWDITRALSAIEAAERAAKEEDALEKLRGDIRLAIEEIGDTVAIPTTPDLVVVPTERPSGTSALRAGLEEQKSILKGLQKVTQQLQAVKSIDSQVAVHGFWPEGHVNAVRSAVSAIVALAYEIADQHNADLQSGKQLRSVAGRG